MVLCSIEECELDATFGIGFSPNVREVTRYIEYDLLQQGVYLLRCSAGLIAIVSFARPIAPRDCREELSKDVAMDVDKE